MKPYRAVVFIALMYMASLATACSVPRDGLSTVQPYEQSSTSTETHTVLPIPSATSSATPKPMLALTSTQTTPAITQTFLPDQYQIETIPPGQYLVGEIYNPSVGTLLNFISLEQITYQYNLENDISPIISPDYKKIVFMRGDQLWIMELQDRTIAEVPNSQGCRFPSWAPDGKSLVAMCQGEIEVITLASGDRILITNWSATEEAWSFPTWSPDGHWIAYINRPTSLAGADPNDGIYVTDTACLANSATCESLTKGPFTQVLHPPIDWSPDSRSLVVTTRNSISVMDLETGALHHILEGDYYPSVVVWSPDGEWIAFDAYSKDIAIVSTRDGKLVTIMQPPPSISLVDWIAIPYPFAPNDQYIITEAGANLNLRAEPSLDGEVLRKLQPGDRVTILDGPVEADGYTWWKVQTEDGTTGWTVNIPEWYVPVSEEATTTPTP
jgi:WD40 repeat protein